MNTIQKAVIAGAIVLTVICSIAASSAASTVSPPTRPRHRYTLTKAERDSLWAVYVPGQESVLVSCFACDDTGIELVVIDNPVIKQARFRRCEVCQPPLWIRQ